MELHSYVNTLKPYWKLIVVAPVIAAVLALAATYLFTKYTARTTVQVFALDADPRVTNLRLENGQAAPPVDSTNASQIVTESAIQQITSRSNATKVVQELHLDQPRQIHNPIDWLKSVGRKTKRVLWDLARYGAYRTKPPFDAAVDAVQGSLSAAQIKNTYTVQVTASASSPAVARDIANTAVQKYIEDARQQRGAYLASRTRFLEVQTLLDWKRVNDIRAQLTTYRQNQSFISAPDQISQQVSSVAQIEAQIRQVQASLSTTRAQLAPIASQLAQLSPDITTTTSGPGGPSTVTSPNPIFQDLQSTKLSLERQVASLQAQGSTLQAALTAKNNGASDLVSRDSQVAALQTELALVQSSLTVHQAQLDSAREAQNQPADQFQVVEPAIAPLYPASPLKYLWVGAAVVLSVALAVMLAFVLDYYNLGLRGPQHAADLLGAPTLAVVSGARRPEGVFIPREASQ